jgi:hypothetical protein
MIRTVYRWRFLPRPETYIRTLHEQGRSRHGCTMISSFNYQSSNLKPRYRYNKIADNFLVLSADAVYFAYGGADPRLTPFRR